MRQNGDSSNGKTKKNTHCAYSKNQKLAQTNIIKITVPYHWCAGLLNEELGYPDFFERYDKKKFVH